MYSEGSAGCTYVERMRDMSFKDVYVATMTKDGIIKTYINGKEKEF